jgi:hypothetical protein
LLENGTVPHGVICRNPLDFPSSLSIDLDPVMNFICRIQGQCATLTNNFSGEILPIRSEGDMIPKT